MMRWFWKRWVYAAVCGTTLVVGLAAAQKSDAPQGPPKVGDVITLKFANGPDRQVKVLKSEKQPDGSYLSEVKDAKTGETFSLLDQPGDFTPPDKTGGGKSEPPKPTTTKSNARPADPLLPKSNMPAEQAKEKEKERKLFGNMSVFSSKTPAPAMPANPPPKEEERPGFLKRVFGKKSPPPPANAPGTTTSAKPGAPALAPGATAGDAMPPAVRPTPGTRPTPGAQRAPASGASTPPLFPGGTTEPPRSRPGEPVTPPTAVNPVPVAPPTAPPVSIPSPLSLPSSPTPAMPMPVLPRVVPPIATPAPLPLPSAPAAPAIPAVPTLPPATTVPAPGSLPTIPVPPGGLSSVKPAIMPAGYTASAMPPMQAEMMEDIRESATTLRTGSAPSKRALAARSLAGGRHGSSDAVKAMLFGTAQDDPSALVRAVCIEELCKLGYREPAYMAFLKKACDDHHPDVSSAAKDAMAKLAPKK